MHLQCDLFSARWTVAWSKHAVLEPAAGRTGSNRAAAWNRTQSPVQIEATKSQKCRRGWSIEPVAWPAGSRLEDHTYSNGPAAGPAAEPQTGAFPGRPGPEHGQHSAPRTCMPDSGKLALTSLPAVCVYIAATTRELLCIYQKSFLWHNCRPARPNRGRREQPTTG